MSHCIVRLDNPDLSVGAPTEVSTPREAALVVFGAFLATGRVTFERAQEIRENVERALTERTAFKTFLPDRERYITAERFGDLA